MGSGLHTLLLESSTSTLRALEQLSPRAVPESLRDRMRKATVTGFTMSAHDLYPGRQGKQGAGGNDSSTPGGTNGYLVEHAGIKATLKKSKGSLANNFGFDMDHLEAQVDASASLTNAVLTQAQAQARESSEQRRALQKHIDGLEISLKVRRRNESNFM